MTKEEILRDRARIKNITMETHEAWVCEWGVFARDRLPLYINALEAAQERLARVDAVWEKHKHRDALLAEDGWTKHGKWTHEMLYDLWQAVRKEGP